MPLNPYPTNPVLGDVTQVDGFNPQLGYFVDVAGANLPAATNAPITVTLTNNTVAAGNLGNRSCLKITDGNTAATDKTTYSWPGSMLLQPNKHVKMRGSIYLATTTPDVFFGLGAIGTDPVGTPPTDYIAIQKLSAEGTFSIIARKASGTQQKFAFGPTLASATWYDFEISIIQPTGAAAGTGHVDIWFGSQAGMGAGGGSTAYAASYSFDLASQFPDTVVMGPMFELRAGATDAQVHGIDRFSCVQEL